MLHKVCDSIHFRSASHTRSGEARMRLGCGSEAARTRAGDRATASSYQPDSRYFKVHVSGDLGVSVAAEDRRRKYLRAPGRGAGARARGALTLPVSARGLDLETTAAHLQRSFYHLSFTDSRALHDISTGWPSHFIEC